MAAEVRAWIGVGIVLILNTIGGVWWAATLTETLSNLREQVRELKVALSNGYSAADARRDLDAIQRQLADHEQRLRGVETRRLGGN